MREKLARTSRNRARPDTGVRPPSRAAVVIAGTLAAAAVVLFATPAGARFLEFWRGTLAEVRKVAWPSRKETIQSTFVVFAFVTTMALFLWLTDKTLEWVLYDLILGWK